MQQYDTPSRSSSQNSTARPLRFTLLEGASRYDVFAVWLESLRKALIALGCDVRTHTVTQPFPPSSRTRDHITLGFNLIRNWDAATADQPHLLWLVDPPPYMHIFFVPEQSGLPVRADRCVIACVDEDWTRMAEEIYSAQNMLFLPHATSLSRATPPDHANKEFDVAFFGSIEDPNELLRSLKTRAAQHWPLLSRLLDGQQAYPGRPLWEAAGLLAREMSWSKAQLYLFLNLYYMDIDRYFRNLDRRQCVLDAARFCTVHIFGSGAWERMPWPSGVRLHEARPFAQLPDLMSRSKVVLNHSPAHRAGAHERIFDALLCGATVLTTPSRFIQKEFPPGNGVVMPANQHAWTEALASALEQTPDAITKGQQHVLSAHTMRNRAEKILLAMPRLLEPESFAAMSA